jgi:hypothetical protein
MANKIAAMNPPVFGGAWIGWGRRSPMNEALFDRIAAGFLGNSTAL